MNRFSIWTYTFILTVMSIGVIYSLPNLYPAKPAIQIAYTDSGKSADQILLNQVKDILEGQSTGVESVGLKDNNIIAKFNSFDDQLAGKAALQKTLLDEAIVALNLEPSTPQWLRDIGGGPLKLGLDLSGGVHFLLEVDIDSALDNRLESLLNQYRKKFRDDRINVESSRKDNKDLLFSFASPSYPYPESQMNDCISSAINNPATNSISKASIINYCDCALKAIIDDNKDIRESGYECAQKHFN